MTAIASASQATSVLANVRRTIAESVDLDEIRKFRDQAELILHYVKAASLGLEMQNQAAEVKLLCERRVGKLLRDAPLRGGDRRSEHRVQGATLEQFGIDKSKSSRWQREASVTDEEFAAYVQHARQEARELTSQGLLRLARLHTDEAKAAGDEKNPFSGLVGGLRNLAHQQKRFACIYADPPWPRGGKGDIARLPKRLCSLPIKSVAAPQAHLHLWVPPQSLESGLAVLRAWGFRYKTMAVRRKPAMDYGDYWRQSHEVLLLGVRGRLPFRDSSLSSWLDEHGDSATAVCALIARASPTPYLDLFGTAVGTGWLVAGSRP
jgi:hypothetical protein